MISVVAIAAQVECRSRSANFSSAMPIASAKGMRRARVDPNASSRRARSHIKEGGSKAWLRALQVNEIAGAFSGFAMGLDARATAILLPMLYGLFF